MRQNPCCLVQRYAKNRLVASEIGRYMEDRLVASEIVEIRRKFVAKRMSQMFPSVLMQMMENGLTYPA